MSIIDNLFARFGYTKATGQKVKYPDWALAQADAFRYGLDIPQTPVSLYTKLSWISTAIDFVAGAYSGTELEVYSADGNEDTEDKEIPNHDFLKLLRNPNPLQTESEFKRDLAAWYATTGNAYIWLNTPNETTAPVELWLLPSNAVTPIPDGRMYIRGYLYDTGNKKIPLEPYEICHIKTYNPNNPFVGMSAIESLGLVAKTDIAQQAWNYALFADDNAKLPGALAFADTISDDEWKRMKTEAGTQWGGTRRSGPMMLRGVGVGGVQWLSMSATQKEMEFLESRQDTRDEIWQKLAPGLASILTQNSTEANAIAGKSIFIEYKLFPMAVQIAEKLSKIVARYGENLYCYPEDMRESNRLMDLQERQAYERVHTIDEVRAEYDGDDPIGDERGKLLPAQIGAFAGALQETTLPAGIEAPEAATPQPPSADKPDEPPSEDVERELKAWENFALKRLGKVGGREFEPRHVDLFTAGRIKAALKSARTPDDVRAVFSQHTEPDLITAAVLELRRYNDSTNRGA